MRLTTKYVVRVERPGLSYSVPISWRYHWQWFRPISGTQGRREPERAPGQMI